MPAMGPVAEYAGAEGGLLERSAFLEALEESFDDVASGGGRLVLVSGEAGIGKSTLVRRFCETRGSAHAGAVGGVRRARRRRGRSAR